MTSDVSARNGIARWLSHMRRRALRWYAITCAREDAARIGFAVPDRL